MRGLFAFTICRRPPCGRFSPLRSVGGRHAGDFHLYKPEVSGTCIQVPDTSFGEIQKLSAWCIYFNVYAFVQDVSILSREPLPAPSNIKASELAINNKAHW